MGLGKRGWWASVALVGVVASEAQVSPNGAQFQVNTYTTGAQRRVSVGSAPDGRFVVVWSSEGSSGDDVSFFSVQGQRFAPSGAPVGAEFQVNSYTTGSQIEPDVAVAEDGEFIVVWTSFGSPGNDSLATSIQGQRFSAEGVPLGVQFQVNSFTSNAQDSPRVAIRPTGEFVVVWTSTGAAADGDGYSVQGQRYDAVGAPQGAQFQVNSLTTFSQYKPAVSMNESGAFIVAWSSGDGVVDADYGIRARRYLDDGSPVASEFLVNARTTGYQLDPAVSLGDDGSFIVAWSSVGSAGSDSNGASVQVRRFDAAGSPLGLEAQVNVFTTSNQRRPALALDSRGQFVVVWESTGSSGGDSSASSVQGRRYLPTGAPLTGEFQVNTNTTFEQAVPDVAVDGRGNLVILFEDNGATPEDPSSQSVQGRRYDDLFRDGFESAGTSRWSATQ